MDFIIGTTSFATVEVTNENTAVAVGSGSLPVFATPAMAAVMESAAAKCADRFLNPHQTSVGISLNLTHICATPAGMTVTACAELIEVDKKRLKFNITAKDEVGEIGRGTHERVIVNSSEFLDRANSKKEKIK